MPMSTNLRRADAQPASHGYARWGWVFAAVWLVYLGQPLGRINQADAGIRALGYLALAAFVVLFLVGVGYGRRLRMDDRSWPQWQPITFWLGLAAAMLAMMPGAGETALVCMAFLSAFAAASFAPRLAIAVVVTLLLVTEVATRTVSGWEDHGYGLGVLLAAVAAGGFRLAFERNKALVRAQEELAAVAVEEERSRIARDLHDILGHSLTVITVKAELARRLLDVDTERTRKELDDLEQLSRDALSDVRATALGVRGVSLANEIAQARTALETAGIDAVVPTAADAVPSRWREVFAWTIREAVTNVVRHSRARRCVVEVTGSMLRISDDGVGLGPSASAGQGLAGLRQRIESAGASLRTGPGLDGRGVELLVEVPV